MIHFPFPNNNVKDFDGYLPDTIEYPRNIAFMPLPWNCLYEYVSSTFLDGFVNYVKPEKCYLINRYCDWNIKEEHHEETKQEILDKFLINPGYHTELGRFHDDIILLSSIEVDDFRHYNFTNEEELPEFINKSSFYMVFWFDQDSSDCCIGRFITQDSKITVMTHFNKWVEDTSKKYSNYFKDSIPYKEIPVNLFKGWIKW